MSEPVFKIGRAIKVMYQAADAQTGLTIQMDVYDETQSLVSGSSVSAMPEIGNTGRYRATFTPDAQGDWHVQIFNSADNSGRVTRIYDIGGSDVDSIGDVVGQIKAQTDALPGTPASQSDVDAVQAAIINEIDQLASPAMMG